MGSVKALAQSPYPGPAIVLGGSGGIGQALCRALAADGLDVFLSYGSRADVAHALCEELRGLGVKAGCAQARLDAAQDLAAFVEEGADFLGGVGVAIYAAGPPMRHSLVGQTPLAEWQRVAHADQDGFFAFASACLPFLKRTAGGSLTAITTSATGRPWPRYLLSAAPKVSIEMMVRLIAREEGRNGVRANCVAPGMLDVGIGRAIMDESFDAERLNLLLREIPLRRVGDADDVVEAVRYLASNRAKYVSGQILAVDGGMQA